MNTPSIGISPLHPPLPCMSPVSVLQHVSWPCVYRCSNHYLPNLACPRIRRAQTATERTQRTSRSTDTFMALLRTTSSLHLHLDS